MIIMAAVSPEFFNSAGKRKTLVAECQGIKWPESRRSGAPKANTVVCGNARALVVVLAVVHEFESTPSRKKTVLHLNE